MANGKEYTEYDYINFPISLVNGYLCEDEDVIFNIFCYSAYRAAQGLEWDFYGDFETIFTGYGLQSSKAAIKNAFNVGAELFNNCPPKQPFAGVKTSLLLEYYFSNKTEFEKLCLLGFIALKSIIGSKEYSLTNNKMLFSRMDGKIKLVEFSELSDEVKKYVTTKDRAIYWSKKIREALTDNWNMSFYGTNVKGFYFSNKPNIDYVELGVKAGEKKKANAFKRRQAEKEALEAQIQARLNGEPKPKKEAVTEPKKPVPDEVEIIYEANAITVDWVRLANQFTEVTGKQTIISDKVKKQVTDRLKEGYTKENIIDAVCACYNSQWHKQNNHQYLTLEFITQAEKMNMYAFMNPEDNSKPKDSKAFFGRQSEQTVYNNLIKFTGSGRQNIGTTNQMQPRYEDD